VDAHTFTKQTETVFKKSAYQKLDDRCFLGQKKVQKETTVTSEVYCGKKKCLGPSREKGVEC
jgi:hypothetical protein